MENDDKENRKTNSLYVLDHTNLSDYSDPFDYFHAVEKYLEGKYKVDKWHDHLKGEFDGSLRIRCSAEAERNRKARTG